MWCTPSVVPGQEFLDEILAADVSASWGAPGSLLHHTGAFADTEDLLARVHGADRAFPTPEGSTGANRILVWALARRDPHGVVLVDRNAHKSVLSALITMDLRFAFLPPNRHVPRFDAALPPTPDAVVEGLRRYPDAAAVLLTSPTYAGVLADLHRIVAVVRDLAPHAVVHVDSAWGAHLPFDAGLARHTAMAAGADSAVLSTHKQAGSLQQGAVLLWNEERLVRSLVHRAIDDQVTTSPSCLIVASIDAATRALVRNPQRVEDLIAWTALLKARLSERLAHPQFLDDHLGDDPDLAAVLVDPTKLAIALCSYGISGFELARQLEVEGIVVEKATANSILLLATFALDEDDVLTTACTIADLLALAGPPPAPKPLLQDPFGALEGEPAAPPGDVARHAERWAHPVPIDESVGLVAAERLEAYPPGIPVVLEGFVVTRAAVDYLRSVRDAGGRISGGDPALEMIRVIPPGTWSTIPGAGRRASLTPALGDR